MKNPTCRMARICPFNMIEIVLALGVVAIGVVSILALFPVGSNAVRDGMAESYAANAADQFLHQLEYMLRQDWDSYAVAAGGLKENPPSSDRLDESDSDLVPNSGGTIYKHKSDSGRYRVLRYVDRPDAGGSEDEYDVDHDVLDFEGVMRVWKDKVKIPAGDGLKELDYEVAVGLNVEISWPAQLPYERRNKSTFRYELFNR